MASLPGAVLLLLLGAGAAPPGPASEGTVIAGVVRDAEESPVAGASVSIVLTGGKYSQQTETKEHGEFFFAPAPEGQYNITIEKAGFARVRLEGVTATAAEPARVEVVMIPGNPPPARP